MVSKLTTIVTLQNCNFCIELRFDGAIEDPEYEGGLLFVRDKKDPSKAGMVINKGHKPWFNRRGNNPELFKNITMDQGEGLGWVGL